MKYIVSTLKIETSTSKWGGIMDNLIVCSAEELFDILSKFNVTHEQKYEVCHLSKFDNPIIFTTEWEEYTVFIQIRVF